MVTIAPCNKDTQPSQTCSEGYTFSATALYRGVSLFLGSINYTRLDTQKDIKRCICYGCYCIEEMLIRHQAHMPALLRRRRLDGTLHPVCYPVPPRLGEAFKKEKAILCSPMKPQRTFVFWEDWVLKIFWTKSRPPDQVGSTVSYLSCRLDSAR